MKAATILNRDTVLVILKAIREGVEYAIDFLDGRGKKKKRKR